MATMKIVRQTPTCKASFQLTCETCDGDYLYFGSVNKASERRFCSRACLKIGSRGNLSPTWKGKVAKNHDYRVLTINGMRVLEHRHVMEQTLGRKLRPGETVHHKNTKRADNRPGNLELCASQGQHNNHHATTFRNETHKQCTICRKRKPRTEFSSGSKGTIHLDPHDTRCKTCNAKRKAEYDRRKREVAQGRRGIST